MGSYRDVIIHLSNDLPSYYFKNDNWESNFLMKVLYERHRILLLLDEFHKIPKTDKEAKKTAWRNFIESENAYTDILFMYVGVGDRWESGDKMPEDWLMEKMKENV